MSDMNTDISSVESSLVNGKRYSTTFLACVAAGDWEAVDHLYLQQESTNGFWNGCKEDTATLRNMAAKAGYEIQNW